jgi:hypothetical protein
MRRITSGSLQSTNGQGADGFFDRIIKYIPADIVAGWVALNGFSKDQSQTVLWGIFVVVAGLAFFWTKKQTDAPGKPVAMTQCIIAVVSFAVWAFALPSGPFIALGYSASLGSIALILYTLGIGLVVPKEA